MSIQNGRARRIDNSLKQLDALTEATDKELEDSAPTELRYIAQQAASIIRELRGPNI